MSPTSANGKMPESKGTLFSCSSIRINPLALASSTTNFLIFLETVGSSATQTTIFPATFFGLNDPG